MTPRSTLHGRGRSPPAVKDARRWVGAASKRLATPALCAIAATCGCAEHAPNDDQAPAIVIGVSLPFSGREAALGRNLEQALILAVEDVNRAGGIVGVPLALKSSDSHSDLIRGEESLSSLIYDENISYLIGPEENELSSRIASDIKSQDILQVLAGFASPSTRRVTSRGAWLRLAPSAWETGCALASYAVDHGIASANTLSSLENYNVSLSSDFLSIFSILGGKIEPSVTVQPQRTNYASAIDRVLDQKATITLLVTYPVTAAKIVADWSASQRPGKFYLSPLLHTNAFLLNIPSGALDGADGISPTLSLASECETERNTQPGPTISRGSLKCQRDNAAAFAEHFAQRWSGTQPFPAGHFYYDAILLLAFGMQYSRSARQSIPSTQELHRTIIELSQPSNRAGSWHDLKRSLSRLAQGEPLRYVGAAKEYEFDQYGGAQHHIFDTWTIRHHAFSKEDAYYARCNEVL